VLSSCCNPLPCSTFVFVNRRRIILIILLVTVALVTLVAIQLYWINSAIKVEESHFHRRVNEVAGNIANKLQKMELARDFNLRQRSDQIMRSLDSLSYVYYSQMLNDSLKPSGHSWSRQYEQVDVFRNDHWETIRQLDTMSFLEGAPGSDRSSIESNYRQQTEMLSELFEEMIIAQNPGRSHERYDKASLDSMIGVELSHAGLRTEYEFGIFSSMQNRLLIEKTGDFTQALLDEGFVYPLAPGNLFSGSDYLVLYFPKQMRFMLNQLTGMLAVSILIVLILIGAFYYAIRTIIQQKKLSLMKTDFINNMTHEFKTPISTVALACEALGDKDIQKSESLYKNYISIISEENRRLGVMAEKILQTAILEKGELKLRPELFDIHEIIRDVVKTMSIQVEIRDGQILTDLQASHSTLMADKVHITNIITNLLDNANKYTPSKPRIEVSTSNVENGIHISVSDNGVGISKSNQSKVFEKLYRVPTGNIHNVKGYGLGLSYVKFIVDKHKGSITVESEQGQGTRFRILLPFGS
jgi:two-component system, OmpR family, phosphate regulon sensor histidine kinase PhoR